MKDIQWFNFQGIVLHPENNINSLDEHFQLLLKVLSVFKLIIWYDGRIVQNNIPDADVIMCINCGKTIGCTLDNQAIEDFITPFGKNMVFQNVGLSWIFQTNQ